MDGTHEDQTKFGAHDELLVRGVCLVEVSAHQRFESGSVSAPEDFRVDEVGVVVGEGHLDPFGCSARLGETEELSEVLRVDWGDMEVYGCGCNAFDDGYQGVWVIVAVDDEVLELGCWWFSDSWFHLCGVNDGYM